MGSIKEKTFRIIQIGNKEDIPSTVFDIFIVINIFANITCMFLDTFEELSAYFGIFSTIETVTVVFFCVEYALRIWTADLLYPDLKPARARLAFLKSYDGIVDLLTIMPFVYFSGFVAFRMLRVVRIFHLFRLNTGSDSFNVITTVLMEKKNQILSSVFILLVLMFASSLCIYSVEHEANPDQFKNAFSGVWWAMATMFTIGYGDIYPITVAGRIFGIITAFLGVGVVAIPTGIISAGFVEQYNKASHNKGLVDVNQVGEILVDKDTDGISLGEFMEKYDCMVYLLIRDGNAILPTANVICKEGDMLILHDENIIKNRKTYHRKK